MDYGAEEFVQFLRLFLKKYPRHTTDQIILAGESYAGKYLPHFTYYIERYNEKND